MFDSDKPSWQNPKVLTTLLLIFVAGAFTGAVSMRVGIHNRLHTNTTLRDPGKAKDYLARWQKDLELSPEQTKQMSSILDDYKQYYEQLEDQIEEVRATGKGRILAILTPEQRQKFERVLADSR